MACARRGGRGVGLGFPHFYLGHTCLRPFGRVFTRFLLVSSSYEQMLLGAIAYGRVWQQKLSLESIPDEVFRC